MYICFCPRALGICKNIGIQTYFGSLTAKSVRGFHHFALCIKVPRLATFFIAPKNCIFWGASFEPIKNLATLGTRKLQGFHGTPLYHCSTLVYMRIIGYICVLYTVHGVLHISCQECGSTTASAVGVYVNYRIYMCLIYRTYYATYIISGCYIVRQHDCKYFWSICGLYDI